MFINSQYYDDPDNGWLSHIFFVYENASIV
jgi:hypothetical protein